MQIPLLRHIKREIQEIRFNSVEDSNKPGRTDGKHATHTVQGNGRRNVEGGQTGGVKM